MRNLIFAIPLLLILARCSSPNQGEIAQLDSLLVLMDSAKSVVHKLDSGLIFQRRTQINKNLYKISASADTMPREDIFLIDKYSSYFKAYSKWSGQIEMLYDEVEIVPMQLTNLKTDLSKNLIEEEKIAEYVKTESEMARVLIESIMKMDMGMKKINEPYIETEEKIILLIQRLESEKPIES